jgi:hypothetical protein
MTSSVRIKTLDSEIDKSYHCRLCGAHGFVSVDPDNVDSETTRTQHPGKPGALNWIDCRLDQDCMYVLDVGYRLDKQEPTGPFYDLDNDAIIKLIEKDSKEIDSKLLETFLDRKRMINACDRIVAEEGSAEIMNPRGACVSVANGEETNEIFQEFDFWKWSDYQADESLGNKTGSVKAGHVEMTWGGNKGVAEFKRHAKATHVQILKKCGHNLQTCVATTINESELYEGELDQAGRESWPEDNISFILYFHCAHDVTNESIMWRNLSLRAILIPMHSRGHETLHDRLRGTGQIHQRSAHQGRRQDLQ